MCTERKIEKLLNNPIFREYSEEKLSYSQKTFFPNYGCLQSSNERTSNAICFCKGRLNAIQL